MDAFELYTEKQKPTGIFACGKCRKLVLNPHWLESGQSQSTREAAEKCCRPLKCDTCGKEYAKRYPNDSSSECRDCENARHDIEAMERTRKRLEVAVDVTETHDGPVYIENCHGGDMGYECDGFFSGIDSAAEYCREWDDMICEDDEGREIYIGPEWAFTCTARVDSLDLDRVIENLCSDGYEGMEDNVTIPQSLKDGVAEFNLINGNALTCWEVDYKHKVRINLKDEHNG